MCSYTLGQGPNHGVYVLPSALREGATLAGHQSGAVLQKCPLETLKARGAVRDDGQVSLPFIVPQYHSLRHESLHSRTVLLRLPPTFALM